MPTSLDRHQRHLNSHVIANNNSFGPNSKQNLYIEKTVVFNNDMNSKQRPRTPAEQQNDQQNSAVQQTLSQIHSI